LTELSFENRDAILDSDVAMDGLDDAAGDEETWAEMDGLRAIPPGEEGMFMSNAGGDNDVFFEILDYAVPRKYVTKESRCA
jgi:hypothetical protein